MINIILTLDYEIFGNGNGDVKKHIINPTNLILQTCNKYKIPLTIMFEVNEYLKFEEYDKALTLDLGYSPATIIKEQISDAFNSGHDIQLHIHPQWIDAKYENKKWLMKNPNRSITELSKYKINKVINTGVNSIQSLLSPININYRCTAMRLTNLPWVEAPSEVFPHMKKNRIIVHSLSTADAIKNNNKGYWSLDKSNLIYEIPIHSILTNKYKKLTPRRTKAALYRKIFTKNYSSKKITSDKQKKLIVKKFLSIFWEKTSIKWDFSKQSFKSMEKFLTIAMNKYNYKTFEVPLIMIGHSKDFFNSKNLDIFFNNITNDSIKYENVRFISLSKFINNEILK